MYFLSSLHEIQYNEFSRGAKKTAVHCECQRLDDAQTLLIYLISSYWNFSGFIVIFRSNITHCLWKFPAHRARGNILCPRNRGFEAALIQRQYFAILLSPCSCSCCCHAFSIHLFFLLLRCPSCSFSLYKSVTAIAIQSVVKDKRGGLFGSHRKVSLNERFIISRLFFYILGISFNFFFLCFCVPHQVKQRVALTWRYPLMLSSRLIEFSSHNSPQKHRTFSNI